MRELGLGIDFEEIKRLRQLPGPSQTITRFLFSQEPTNLALRGLFNDVNIFSTINNGGEILNGGDLLNDGDLLNGGEILNGGDLLNGGNNTSRKEI
jgi:hypothetical protein